ncbi:hypothetical protein ACTXT7_016228 [Hymenolepis weldensis]
MREEATFLEKTIFRECYFIDRNINLMGLDSALTYHSGHYNNKFTSERVRCYSTLTDNKQISYLYSPSTHGVPETLVTDPSTQFKSTFCLILLRLIDYSAKEISRRSDPMRAYGVGDLAYVLNHNLNHQWAAAMITESHDGDIYDVENGKDT